MVRTQIQLSPRQVQALKALASSRGVSMAEVIRIAIDEMLRAGGQISRKDLWDLAIRVAGRHHSGRNDLSERHDEYLAEIYDE